MDRFSQAKLAGIVAIVLAGMLGFSPAAMAQEICLPPHVGLPNQNDPAATDKAPKVDGFVDREPDVDSALLIGGTLANIDQGWVGSPLAAYHDGGTEAPMEFRAIAHNSGDFVYFSFIVRNDTDFNRRDRIVLIVDPGWTGGAAPTAFSANARRLDIQPVDDIAGAPGAAGTGLFSIREDRDPFDKAWLKYDPTLTIANKWVDFAGAPPSSAQVRVRSWERNATDKGWAVEVKLPTAATGEWPDIGASFGLYINVIRVCTTSDVCGSPVAPLWFSTQFTWPRADYDTGNRLITNSTPGLGLKEVVGNSLSAPWLGLARRAAATSCAGVRFAGDAHGIGVLSSSGTLGTTIQGPASGATNTMVARLANDSGVAQPGVTAEFRIANWGIGRAGATWTPIPVHPAGALPTGSLNTGNNANPTSPASVPTTGGDLRMLWQVTTADNYCDPDAGPCPAGSRDAHSCIWVLLNSGQPVDISQSSVRRNFDIVNLSSVQRVATIDGKGWGKAAGPNGHQEFKLFARRRFFVHPGQGSMKDVVVPVGVVASELQLPRRIPTDPGGVDPLHPGEGGALDPGGGLITRAHPPDQLWQAALSPLERVLLQTKGIGSDVLWNYVWMVTAARKTKLTFTDGKDTFVIYEPAGEFGMIGQHFGQIDRLVDGLDLANPLLKQVAPDHFELLVAEGQQTKIGTVVAALDKGEEVQKPPNGCPGGGCCRCSTAVESTPSLGLTSGLLVALALFGRRRRRAA